MSPIFFILKKTLINSIKELKTKPGALVGYCFLIVLFIFIIISLILMPNKPVSKHIDAELISAVVTGIVLVVSSFLLFKSLENGSSFFRMADVNLLFTSPLSSRKVLAYGFVKQAAASVLVLFFLFFQVPNLRVWTRLDNTGAIVIIVSAVFFLFTLGLLGMLLYSLSVRFEKLKGYIIKGITACGIVLGALILYKALTIQDGIAAIKWLLSMRFYSYIPVIGSFREVFLITAYGFTSSFYINIILNLVYVAIIIALLYKVNVDFYEDVLGATELKETTLRSKREGRVSYNFKKAKKVSKVSWGTGAKAIFYRQMLEYRKSGFIFIDKRTIIFIFLAIVSRYVVQVQNMAFGLFYISCMLFFFNMQGKWNQELGKPYIYLIPDSSFKKTFYATLPELIKNLVDGIIMFAVSAFVFKADLFTIISCALTFASYGLLFTYSDVLCQRIFGTYHSKVLYIFVKLFLAFFVIIPGVVLAFIFNIFVFNEFMLYWPSLYIIIVLNIIFGSLMLIPARRIFENIELEK